MTTSDRFDQYAQDEPSWTLPPPAYQWVEPTRSRPSRQVAMGLGGFARASGAGGGGGGAYRAAAKGDVGESLNRWRQSEERADRLRQQYEGPIMGRAVRRTRRRAWAGTVGRHGQDCQQRNQQAGLLKDEGWGEGTAGVRVPAKPNGVRKRQLDWSGAAARPIPTGVSF